MPKILVSYIIDGNTDKTFHFTTYSYLQGYYLYPYIYKSVTTILELLLA